MGMLRGRAADAAQKIKLSHESSTKLVGSEEGCLKEMKSDVNHQ